MEEEAAAAETQGRWSYHVHSQETEKLNADSSPLFPPFILSRTQVHAVMPPHSERVFPPSVKKSPEVPSQIHTEASLLGGSTSTQFNNEDELSQCPSSWIPC